MESAPNVTDLKKLNQHIDRRVTPAVFLWSKIQDFPQAYIGAARLRSFCRKPLAKSEKIVYNSFAIIKKQLERAAGHTEVRVLRDGTP